MAEKRMFTQKIIDSDAFLDMPLTTQALYFHIGMRAKNKGILNNLFTIARSIGCTNDDIRTLYDKGYINPILNSEFEEWEIVHWYENNGIGENARERNCRQYRQWRKAVIERDAVCMHCGSAENLQAHHIKSFAEHPLLRTEKSNGITLCKTCHKRIHKKGCKHG